MGGGQVKIAAVMTAGRYENTFARNMIEKALKTLGIPLTVSGGVYYGQCMQMMFEQVCDTDCELVLTIDGDSIFTAKQLERLINVICQEKDIDALTAIQMRRGKQDMLGTALGERVLTWSGYPIRVRTAHFGLTAIRVEKLRQTPKPWFVSTPDSEGRWSAEKVDDDVHFWINWEKAGNSLYIDPGVRLGHLEEMVSVFDSELKPVHMYPADWQESMNGC